jgi:hypothetical protein
VSELRGGSGGGFEWAGAILVATTPQAVPTTHGRAGEKARRLSEALQRVHLSTIRGRHQRGKANGLYSTSRLSVARRRISCPWQWYNLPLTRPPPNIMKVPTMRRLREKRRWVEHGEAAFLTHKGALPRREDLQPAFFFYTQQAFGYGSSGYENSGDCKGQCPPSPTRSCASLVRSPARVSCCLSTATAGMERELALAFSIPATSERTYSDFEAPPQNAVLAQSRKPKGRC